MNYRYEIEGDRMRMVGTLNSRDLPDLTYVFHREAKKREAVSFYENRTLVAAKGDCTVSMRIIPCEGYYPGRSVEEAIELMMEKVF